MNFKCLLLITALIAQVSDAESDCDEFLKCLANVFRDFYGSNANVTNMTSNKEDEIVDDTSVNEQKQNVSINVFELTDLQKSLDQILTDATSLIKDEIEGKLKIVSESEFSKTLNNDTEIYVKAIDLKKVNDDNLNNEDKVVVNDKPEVFVGPLGTGLVPEIILSNKENSKDFNASDSETGSRNTNFVSHLPILLHDQIDKNKTNANTAYDTNPIQQFQLDKILPSQDEIQDFLDKLIANNNDTEINLEPFHVDIFPELDLEKDIVSNDTQILEKNISVTKLPDSLLDSIDKILKINTDNGFQAPKSVEHVPENIVHNIEFKIDSKSDLNQTQIDVTKAFVIQITNKTNINLNAYENVQENEIPSTDQQDFEQYYEDNTTDDDNATDYPVIDYIELYKDTTNEYIEFKPTEIPTDKNIRTEGSKADLDNVIEYFVAKEDVLRNEDNENYTLRNNVSEIFPWIATIFVKNGTSNQFDYFCDGAIVSEKAIVTAAHCVNTPAASQSDAENFLIIVGKTSLQATRAGDRVHRVKQLKIHENYTTSANEAANDLAILVLEEAIVLSDSVQLANLQTEELDGPGESFTTGWEFSGNLTGIHFEKEKSHECKKDLQIENVFCATYGNAVAICPSYGGLHVTRHLEQWILQGIRTGDPTTRTFCIDKTVLYTSLLNYVRWIDENIV